MTPFTYGLGLENPTVELLVILVPNMEVCVLRSVLWLLVFISWLEIPATPATSVSPVASVLSVASASASSATSTSSIASITTIASAPSAASVSIVPSIILERPLASPALVSSIARHIGIVLLFLFILILLSLLLLLGWLLLALGHTLLNSYLLVVGVSVRAIHFVPMA
jgi:hypothetical protein